MDKFENSTMQNPQLEIQLDTHKTIGEISFLIGAGIGFLTLLLGIIGSLLLLGITKNPTSWISAAIGVFDCLYMIWLGQKIEKNVFRRNQTFTKINL